MKKENIGNKDIGRKKRDSRSKVNSTRKIDKRSSCGQAETGRTTGRGAVIGGGG